MKTRIPGRMLVGSGERPARWGYGRQSTRNDKPGIARKARKIMKRTPRTEGRLCDSITVAPEPAVNRAKKVAKPIIGELPRERKRAGNKKVAFLKCRKGRTVSQFSGQNSCPDGGGRPSTQEARRERDRPPEERPASKW